MIEVKNVTFGYTPYQQVLKDFSLHFREGGVYGLLGKNGTGKSTLLYLITGLLRPRQGSVWVDGNDSTRRNPDMLSELFIVPEEYDLPAISLQSYVKAIRPFYPRFSQELLEKCLREFEMPMDINLGALSMGQKKKVYICIALAANTKYLLLDEPTNGLDILSKSLFRKVVVTGMSEEKTIIISTHQVHDVEQLLDHILILDQRSLLLKASVQELSEQYTFEYRTPQQMDDSVLYAEPTLQGNAVIARRQEGDAETQINLELLFNYKTQNNH